MIESSYWVLITWQQCFEIVGQTYIFYFKVFIWWLQARLEAKLVGIKEKKAKEAAENPDAAKKVDKKKSKGKKKWLKYFVWLLYVI